MSQTFSRLVQGSLTTLSTILIANSVQAAGLLMIPDSTNDRVMLFDSFDGSLVDENFIDGDGLFTTPINAIQVNNEIWVSDQMEDSIFRFNLRGQLIDTIGGTLDNIRGMEFINDLVYVTNAGTDNGAPSPGVFVLDTNGNNVDFFAVNSPWDVFFYQGELLISNSADDDIERFTLDGTPLGSFITGPTTIDFPQQLAERSSGNVLVTRFSNSPSTLTPGAIIEYDSNGNQLFSYAASDGVEDGGGRGVFELENGNILWTSGNGVFSTNLNDATRTDIFTTSARFIEPLNATIPESSTLAGLFTFGLVGIGSMIKRKRDCQD